MARGSRTAARALIAKYGGPQTFGDDRLAWGQHAPWTRIVVSRAAARDWLGRRGGVIEEPIWYFAPDDRLDDLRRFDARLSYDAGTGELSSRADSEGLNIVALNLADEVGAGLKTPAETRGD